MSQPKVSKIETGAWENLTEGDFVALIEALSPSKEQLADLRTQFEMTNLSPLSYRYVHHQGVDRKQQEIRLLEHRARVVRVYEPIVIPGLLQLPDYSRGLFKALGVPNRDVEAAVAARKQRHEILAGAGRAFEFIIGEAALYNGPAGPEVQAAQLSFLMAMLRRPNLRVGVLSYKSGVPPVATNAFTMLDNFYVTAETLTDEAQATDRHDIAVYAQAFHQLQQRAYYKERAIVLMGAALQEAMFNSGSNIHSD